MTKKRLCLLLIAGGVSLLLVAQRGNAGDIFSNLDRGLLDLDKDRLRAIHKAEKSMAGIDEARLKAFEHALDGLADIDQIRLKYTRKAIGKALYAKQLYISARLLVFGANLGIKPVRLSKESLLYEVIRPSVPDNIDITQIDLYFGANVVFSEDAITFGNSIFFEDKFNPKDPSLAGLIAHEMTHAAQVARLGGEDRFAEEYVGEAIMSGLHFKGGLHDSSKFEREAIAVGETVKKRAQLGLYGIPEIGQSFYVGLQPSSEEYLRAENAGGGKLGVTRRAQPAQYEVFRICRVDATHITLQAYSGQYLACEAGGGTFVTATRAKAAEYEKMTFSVEGGGISFGAYSGQGLGFENGMLVAKDSISKTRFAAVVPARDVLPSK